MKKIVAMLMFALVVAVAPTGFAAEENPLKKEMRLLDKAFKNLIDALVFDRPMAIAKPFHAVHEAKKATEQALRKGKIKLPKNGDRLKVFAEMDKVFHTKLERLLKAVEKRDDKAIRKGTHDILDSCIQCHRKFRN